MGCVALPSGRIGLLQLPQIGRGPAQDVVMIHGLGANCGFWYASAVQWFRRFGRVTLFDLPGHGESDMPPTGYTPTHLGALLGELLDHLQIDRAHLVAHSFGGAVALSFALRQPRRVISLILADVRLWAVEPPSVSDRPGPRLQRLREAGWTPTDPGWDPSFQVLVDLARLRLEKNEPATPAITEMLPGARNLFPGKRAARKWLQLMETTRAYAEMTDPTGLAIEDVARIHAPILAVYGGLSPRRLSGLELQRVCSRCTLQVIPDVGHFFPLMRPRLFARPALTFLRTTRRNDAALRRRRRGRSVPVGVPERTPTRRMTALQGESEPAEGPAAAGVLLSVHTEG